MGVFSVVATRSTPTNARLGRRADAGSGGHPPPCPRRGARPARRAALARRHRARLVGARDARAARRDRPERRPSLARAHDKLATAHALSAAGVPHPPTVHVAPWLPRPRARAAGRAQAALRQLGTRRRPLRHARRRSRTRSRRRGDRVVVQLDRRRRPATRAAERLRPPPDRRGRLRRRRGLAARGAGRVADERRARRAARPGRAAARGSSSRSRRPRRSAATSSASTCFQRRDGGWVVLEVNGAADFTAAYSLGEEVYSAARRALTGRAALLARRPRRLTRTRRSRGPTCGRGGPPRRARRAAGTARTARRRGRRAAPP